TIGLAPSSLVLEEDQQTMYVATAGVSNISHLDLQSMQVQSVFPAAPDVPSNVSVTALKLAVNPGSPGGLLAKRSDGKLAFYTADTFQFASGYDGSDFVFFAHDRLITPKQSYPFGL